MLTLVKLTLYLSMTQVCPMKRGKICELKQMMHFKSNFGFHHPKIILYFLNVSFRSCPYKAYIHMASIWYEATHGSLFISNNQIEPITKMLYRSYCEGVFSTDQTLYTFLCTRTLHSFLGVSEFFIPVAICLQNLSK